MGKKIWNKLNKYAVFCACVHFLVSFFTDRLIFTYSLWDFTDGTAIIKTIFAWGSKAVFLLFLFVFWQFLFYFVKKADRGFVKFSCIYFCIMCLLLVLVWPGIWRMDEFGILFEARNTFPVFWQHYLTSVFYVLALMLIPIPTGVIILQNFCISLIVGWLLYRIRNLFFTNRQSKIIYLMYIPFLFLPVLDSNLYPMRMSVYAYLELLLLSELVFTSLETFPGRNSSITNVTNVNISGNSKIGNGKIIALAMLSAIVINWRTEAIYYLVALPVCFVVLFWKSTGKKVKSKFIIYTIVGSLLLMVPQKAGEMLFYENSHEYELTSILLPVVPLIGEVYEKAALSSYYPETEEKALAALEDESISEIEKQVCRLYFMDKVLDVNKAAQASVNGKTGISLYWSDSEFVRNYTDEQYAMFKKIYWQLVFENPEVFFKERLETFIQSEDLLENTTELFVKEEVPNYGKFKELPVSGAISNEVRTKVVSILELRHSDDYSTKLSGYSAVYHVLPAIVLEIIILLVLLWMRKWGFSLLLLSHMAKIPLIFLTAPSRLFMYYYPVYLTGYVLVFFLFVVLLERKIRKQKNTKTNTNTEKKTKKVTIYDMPAKSNGKEQNNE